MNVEISKKARELAHRLEDDGKTAIRSEAAFKELTLLIQKADALDKLENSNTILSGEINCDCSIQSLLSAINQARNEQ